MTAESSSSASWRGLTPAGKQMVARGKQLVEGPRDYRNAEMLAPTEGDVRKVQAEAADAVLDELAPAFRRRARETHTRGQHDYVIEFSQFEELLDSLRSDPEGPQ